MLRRVFLTLGALAVSTVLSVPAMAQSEQAQKSFPQVLMETSAGTVMLELYPDKAPKTVENFLAYVNEGFYDGTIFHRVIGNFMVQGGGFTEDMNKKITRAPIMNEADNGLRNRIGTIAMARTNDPHSATAQFFINVAQNSFLDFREKTPRAWGYAVFGRVIKGMKTVNQIRSARTGFVNGMKDVPIEPITIIKMRQVK
ncbi:peptidylprolyl isomerase [Thiomicrorhabdus sediminis]|uniref:Peptidyl-prolyl cis-trans isomerase n=1 Tax=Thiomicrorhabdus sediminis TaxID=2580412 RepID=A0A4V1HHV8_9GAMM|nr:peptidylprolyl isomerase [Thiomicrorhabdus sediminis]QCU90373.1 peptidyl-prolyl cis-trans isomerase [Thiomicrorhabdus sediminis]